MAKLFLPQKVPQDLHIHTTFSSGDSSVVQEQTLELIAELDYAGITGISDHLNYISGKTFNLYEKKVRSFHFKVGVEVGGMSWIKEALRINPDYYIYHILDIKADYDGIEKLLLTGKPVIIAHPLVLGINLDTIPKECLIEINNRYIWRSDWKKILPEYVKHFRFIIGSDAHQPNWLNQSVARHVAHQLGIRETILF
jgi:histidinol phosphatase-like PHP family hydrolase